MQRKSYKFSRLGVIFRRAFLVLTRRVLSLRYKVKIIGLDKIEGPVEKALVLPNHPAYVDPCLVYAYLWPKFRMRPMASAGIVDKPLLSWVKWITKPVIVPYMDVQSQDARVGAQDALDMTIEGLRNGTNHLVYPAGRLSKWGHEHLGGVKGLTDILKAVPDARVLRVRMKGMWGSSLSHAYTGKKPNLVKMFLRGAFLLLVNLLFFMPRRRISIEIEEVNREQLPELRRELINPYFEQWYNEGGTEEPTYRPYHFLFGSKTREFPPLKTGVDVHPRDIKRVIRERVNIMIEAHLGRPLEEDEKKPSMHLESIGLDSLERMELGLEIEEQFHTTGGTQVPTTMLEVWALAAGLLNDDKATLVPSTWTSSIGEKLSWHKSLPPADTITKSLFLRATGPTGSAPAVADSLSGVLPYKRLFLGAYLLSKRIKKLSGTHVGLMLPASVAADVALFAIQLAGKIPVVLNWTTGSAHLEHALKSCEVSYVVTSKKFVDRTGVTIPSAANASLMFLEDIRSSIGTLEKLRELAWLLLRPSSYAKLANQASPSDVAAVLFTSGSEKEPKCVPLTHRNILSAARSGVEAFELTNVDALLAFLPVFHVFGLVVTIMGITSGIRLVHHPDPTAGGALAQKIANYGITVTAAAPTFLNYILERAKPDALNSLRLAVVGAEKCPRAVFESFRQKVTNKEALILEGYGITECSAVVTANTPDDYREGSLGKPLPGVSIMIVDQNSMEPVGVNKSGMILIGGDIVFNGYSNTDQDPFINIDGQRWYKSGDIASLDKDGFIHFEGRLKRFVKISGEMVSLPAMEEPLLQVYPPNDDGPRIGVEGIEGEEGVFITLFTSVPDLELVEANRLLTEFGFKGVVRLHDVQYMSEGLPTLGSGKTDYKVLKALLNSKQNGDH